MEGRTEDRTVACGPPPLDLADRNGLDDEVLAPAVARGAQQDRQRFVAERVDLGAAAIAGGHRQQVGVVGRHVDVTQQVRDADRCVFLVDGAAAWADERVAVRLVVGAVRAGLVEPDQDVCFEQLHISVAACDAPVWPTAVCSDDGHDGYPFGQDFPVFYRSSIERTLYYDILRVKSLGF